MSKRIIRIKDAKTYEEQLAILRSRGLVVSDEREVEAINFLQSISYYRLSAYHLTLRVPNSEQFNEGTTFSDIRGLYEFDQRLRTLLVGILESIEVGFRTRVAYELAHKYGPLGYKNANYFTDATYHVAFMNALDMAVNRGGELFIKHHNTKYDGQYPIWVAMELLPFGAVSKLFHIMALEDQWLVASYYGGARPEFLRTWIHTAVHLRNICAHYGRLYNRPLKVTPKLFRRWRTVVRHNSLFAGILVLREICPPEEQWRQFVDGLGELIREYDFFVDLTTMGFPETWSPLLRTGRIPKHLV